MATYGKLLSRIWSDYEFIALNAQEQQLYMLLLSHPKRNHAGVLSLTLRQWAMVTAGATTDNVRAALMRLAQTRFVVLDWEVEEVLIRTYIRNDGVYTQPKLMTCALRQALETQSGVLRRVIAEELERLPNYVDKPKWQETAGKLLSGPSLHVERLNQEPDSLYQDPEKTLGADGYLSPEGEAPASEHQAPAAAHAGHADLAAHDTAFDLATSERGRSEPVNIGISRLIDKVLPANAVPNAHKVILRLKANELLNNKETEADIAECLRIWLTKTELGPHALGSCMSEVYKKRNNGTPMSTRDRMFMETQALKNDPSVMGKTPTQLAEELFARKPRELRGGSR